jgi:hypothetical protein
MKPFGAVETGVRRLFPVMALCSLTASLIILCSGLQMIE